MPAFDEDPSAAVTMIRRTVLVGGLTKPQLLQEFRRHSISINAYGETLFAAMEFPEARSPRPVETLEVTARDLGFPDGAMVTDLFARAAECGLPLCPLELAPYLRLQYLDQPEGHWITIASPRPPADSNLPSGFYIRRLADGLWLRGYVASDDHVWDADDHFIFCSRDQTPAAETESRAGEIETSSSLDSEVLLRSVEPWGPSQFP
jgi:hypothetical protein